MGLRAFTYAGAIVCIACGTSHLPGSVDAGVDCSTPTCGAEPCRGAAPFCYERLEGGCCGAVRSPICTDSEWSCGAAGLASTECTTFAPHCEGIDRCEPLAEYPCVEFPDCAPVYDDACCPECPPAKLCADCTNLQMQRCATLADACASDPPTCGNAPLWACTGAPPDCSAAFPAGETHCSVAGCVIAHDSSCTDCPPTCVPLLATSCMWSCRVDPPPCPARFAAEADGSCFTGRCIPSYLCDRP